MFDVQVVSISYTYNHSSIYILQFIFLLFFCRNFEHSTTLSFRLPHRSLCLDHNSGMSAYHINIYTILALVITYSVYNIYNINQYAQVSIDNINILLQLMAQEGSERAAKIREGFKLYL